MPTVTKTYRYRYYPTRAQSEQLAHEFGCARFVWNWSLDLRIKAWQRRGESLNSVSVSRILTKLKPSRRYTWLNDVAATCLTQALRDQDKAFKSFFAGDTGYPRFRKKRYPGAVRYQLDQRRVHADFVPGKSLRLPKLGAVKLRWSRLPAGIPGMATVKRDACGRWFITLSVLEDIQPLPVTDQETGLDLGLKDTAVTAQGQKHKAPRHLRQREQQLARAQRSLSRRQKGSARRERQRRKIARIHARVRDARHDFLHKLSSTLINENQVIGIEDLCVKGLKRTRLSKSFSDAGLSELRRQREYKGHWYGRDVIVIGRFLPSSKRCSCCGHTVDTLALSTRSWNCPACGSHHDRDINAACNILHYARTARSAETDARGEPHKSIIAA